MNLVTQALQIQLLPLRAADDEDWVRVQVILSATGFTGDFEAWLQLADLERFEQELAAMYLSVGKPAIAELSSAEPDILVRLEMQPLGGIVGEFSFESERPDGVPTVLKGGFVIDQSFLPDLQQSVNALAVQLKAKNAP
jgi:hypothetical protein